MNPKKPKKAKRIRLSDIRPEDVVPSFIIGHPGIGKTEPEIQYTAADVLAYFDRNPEGTVRPGVFTSLDTQGTDPVLIRALMRINEYHMDQHLNRIIHEAGYPTPRGWSQVSKALGKPGAAIAPDGSGSVSVDNFMRFFGGGR